ncbi:BTB/POZ protein [Rhizophagus irregularis DAOM 181602=DAOM 197198]|nr:BTB/POZ protein [Rhizophagus irregularis DAOM 181602=DAOM 197198]
MILRYIYGGRLSLEEYDTSDIIKILIASKPEKIFNSIDFISLPENCLISLIQHDNFQMSDIQENIGNHVLSRVKGKINFAIYNCTDCGPSFGSDLVLCGVNHGYDQSYCYSSSSYDKSIRTTDDYFSVEEYEIFKL